MNSGPSGDIRREIVLFNEVVDNLEVEDENLVGRKFTRYNSNGSAMSRIDRALVSEEWGEYWGTFSLWILP